MTTRSTLGVRRAGLTRGEAPTGDHVYEIVLLDLDAVLHDVNDRAELAGQPVVQGSALRAIRWTNGGIADLGTLGGSASSARGINSAGLVVGGSLTEGDRSYHAFVYEAGKMQDLNALISPSAGCELIQALGINDRGDIVALAHHRGSDCAVLLKRRE